MIGKLLAPNWERVVPFLDFRPTFVGSSTRPTPSSRSISRKLVYHRGHFPSDEAVTKLLDLVHVPLRRPTPTLAGERDWSEHATGGFPSR